MRFWFYLLLLSPLSLAGQVQVMADSAASRWGRGDYSGAARLYTQASQAAEVAEESAVYLLQAGNAFRKDKQADSAVWAFQELADFPSSSTVVDSFRALGLHQMGLVLYLEGKYQRSLEPYSEAIEIRDRIYPNGHNDCAKTRSNLAFSHARLGALEEAERYWQASNFQYQRLSEPDSLRWLRTLIKLAETYNKLNDAKLVTSVVEQAKPIFRAYFSQDTFQLGRHYQDFGSALNNTGQTEQMSGMLDSAIHYLQLAGADYELLKTVLVKSAAYMENKQFDLALPGLNSIMARAEDLELSDPLRNAAFYNAAVSQHELGQLNAAVQSADAALEGYEAAEAPWDESIVYSLLGNIAASRGQGEKALLHYHTAQTKLLGQAGDLSVAEVEVADLSLLAELLGNRASELIRQEKYQEALVEFDHIFALTDRIRQELSSQESQTWITSNARPLFQEAIGLQYRLYEQSGSTDHAWAALELSERSKAFSLLLTRQQLSIERPRKQRQIRLQIAQLERSQAPDNQAELGRLRIELERLQELSEPPLAELPKFVADSLKIFLALRQQTLLEYALGETASYLFVVSPKGALNMTELKAEPVFIEKVHAFRELIQASAYKQKSLKADQAELDLAYTQAALELFELLFDQLSPEVLKSQDLLIVPDGILGFMPFGALLTAPAPTPPISYTSLPYLLRDRHITYDYSASYLLENARQSRTLADQNLIAFAPSFRGQATAEEASTVRAVQLTSGQRSMPALLPLRHNETEVRAVAELFPRSDNYLSTAATRERFEEAAAGYRILLLSSHAYVDAADPNQSFIAFTQRGDSLETDEMLYLNDLGNLKLPVELAVLSACETSLGKIVPGEGVISLARAFSAAGAASTLTTLWKVEDEATKDFSVNFFTALNQGQSRSEAIATAQLAAINSPDFAHPYYWSAMTLYGNGGKVDIRPGFALNRASVYTLIGLGVAILLGFLWNRRVR